MSTQPMELLVRAFADRHPEEAARALETLEAADAARILRRLSPRSAGPVLERAAPAFAAELIRALGPEAAGRALRRVPPRAAAAILQQLGDEERDAALRDLPDAQGEAVRSALRWPSDAAGGMMDSRIASVPIDLTVAQAQAALRRAPRDTLYYLYVIDREGRLAGVLNTRQLLLARPGELIEPMVIRDVVALHADDDRDTITDLVRRHRFVALPVVDAEGRLLGVVRHEQVLGALQEEAFADVAKMVGAGEDERALAPVREVVRKRLPWLYVNLATAFAAAAVVGLFEGTIERVTALAVLLPVVAGQGGNTGAQALAVVIRGLALGEVTAGTGRRLLTKEAVGGLLNGALVALGTSLAVLLWDGRPALAAVIGAAMIVNMAAAGAAGAAIPLALERLGRDPAQSSSIFLTTVTDVVGFASFLGFASLFLPLLEG